MIGNQDSLEEILSARYVEDYMDFVDNVPNDLQRYLTRYREIDVRVQDFLNETEDLRLEVINAKDALTKERALDKIEQLLIYIQEMADEKIENVQKLQDSIEKKYCQLNIDSDNLRIEFSKRENVVKEEEINAMGFEPVQNVLSQMANETSGQTKKYRRHKDSSDQEYTNVPAYEVAETNTKNANINDAIAGTSTNLNSVASSSISSSLPSSSTSSSSSSSNLKKNNTGQKRRRRKGRVSNAPKDGSPMFDDDLVGEPGEPTYCLCDQISFGEMILCDNDLCPHEWFHFSCVQLSIKPKGKWYCPKCRADKPNVMKPKPLLLKALEKYNKEKEEKMLENGK